MTGSQVENIFGEVIYKYSREQALKDGVLVDVTETAKEAGIRYPTAITRQLWLQYIVPKPRAQVAGQSIQGRLWDVLYLFTIAGRNAHGKNKLYYTVKFLMGMALHKTVRIKAVCSAGDDGEPVLTLMLEDED